MEFVFSIVFGFVFMMIYILYIKGYFDVLYQIYRTYQKINHKMKELNIDSDMIRSLLSSLIDNDNNDNNSMMNMMNIMLKNNNDNNSMMNKEKNKTYISKSGKCLHIYYDYMGKEYMITVPYNGLSSIDMIQYEMFAVYESNEFINITQQPGIPYLINTTNLNCEILKAINQETDVFHNYIDKETPLYCQEICDS